MIITANRANLKKHAKDLLDNEWSEESEKALIRCALHGFERDPYFRHISHDHAAHLRKLDAILHTHGVEGFLEPCDVQYCNTGETYAITLLYWNGKLRIGDWGSIVEHCDQAA